MHSCVVRWTSCELYHELREVAQSDPSSLEAVCGVCVCEGNEALESSTLLLLWEYLFAEPGHRGEKREQQAGDES